ncbi:hypothetical protein [Novipirellula artificiosorum]|uniref:Uncharacterized protein n=1 Tax=Novipirellula artificiosorum TaxID=2528016 RepID=A0A5C6CVY0_9BACT|nr:hypothetical protein [Novipirellula artificiosorum]TWU27995.1 hypothetical protein Poly41_69770 [Novipirellula artificiosorum]
MVWKTRLAWVCIAVIFWPYCWSASTGQEAASKLFPFVVPVDDVSGGVTDMSFLNDRPADP